MDTTTGGLPGAALRRVLKHMDTYAHRRPRVAELSTLLHMSAFHFARLFKQSTGLPPHRFLVRRRIERAKELLASGDLPIAAIAQVVGFRTPSHFTITFRRVTGVTPSTYRAQVGGPPAVRVEPRAPDGRSAECSVSSRTSG